MLKLKGKIKLRQVVGTEGERRKRGEQKKQQGGGPWVDKQKRTIQRPKYLKISTIDIDRERGEREREKDTTPY